VAPLLCVIVSFGLLTAYKHATYTPRYFEDMGARTIWHNALMGFWLSPRIAGKYQLAVSDSAVIQSVLAYMGASHDPRLTPAWTEGNALGSLGGHGSFDWFTYEGAARDLYLHIWRTNTLDAVRAYAIDKPGEMLSVITKAVHPPPTLAPNLPGARFNPFAVVPLLLIVPAVVLFAASEGPVILILGAAVWLLACSLVPGLLFYPVVHTMLGAFMTVTLTCYLALALCAARVVNVFSARSSRPKMSSANS
jgi:hypothetical protein